ncbi:MAG TPA: homoserine kinase [Gemmatimonadales bacterium]|jgi:homoserine kinase
MSGSITIRVPATTSNLGGGFDCIGVAIDRWLSLEASLGVAPEPPTIERLGYLDRLGIGLSEDRLILGFNGAAAAVGLAHPPTVHLRADSEIPVGRGLGSSAAATVAGALAANQLLGLGLAEMRLIEICAEIEGHPDNVAPALLGGGTLVVGRRGTRVAGPTTRPADDGYLVREIDLHPGIALVIVVPDFAIETRRARAVLPEFVPHRVSAGAAARAAALVQGLASADAGLLAAGLDDLLHVPFRRRLVRGYSAVTAAAIQAGAIGATLSGSGSSIVAVALDPSTAAAAGEAMRLAWAGCGVTAIAIQPSIVREFACP